MKVTWGILKECSQMKLFEELHLQQAGKKKPGSPGQALNDVFFSFILCMSALEFSELAALQSRSPV